MRLQIGAYNVGFPESVSTQKEAVEHIETLYPELDKETVKKAVKNVFKDVTTKSNKVDKKSSGSEEKNNGDN